MNHEQKEKDVTYEEHDGLEPVVAHGEGYDEEGNSEEHSNTSDECDEVVDFLGDGSFASLQPRSQAGDSTHHSLITAADHNTPGVT